MITIQKVKMADCDRGTDDAGCFTDDGYQYVVCDDNDISKDYQWFDTEAEAEKFIADEFE